MYRSALLLLALLAPLGAGARTTIDESTRAGAEALEPSLRLPLAAAPSLGTPRLRLAVSSEAELDERMRMEALNRGDRARRRTLMIEEHDAFRPGRVLLGVPLSFIALLSFAYYDTVIADLVYRASNSTTGAQITMVALLPVVQFGGAGAVWVIGRWLEGQGSFGPTYGVGLLTTVVAGGVGVGLIRAGKEDAGLYTLLLGLPAASSVAMAITYEVTSADNVDGGAVPGASPRREIDEPDDGLSVNFAPMAGGGGLVAGLAF